MQTLFPSKPSTATVVLLAASVLLAVVGVGGALAGAADKKDSPKHQALTPTSIETATTASSVDAGTTTTLPGVTTTTRKTTATTARPTATTAAPGPNTCSSTPSNTNPGAIQPPAVGTFSYVSCTDPNSTSDITVAAGTNSTGVVRREVTTSQGNLGTATATAAYGSSGVIQEKLTIKSNGITLQCDWNPDILEYPPDLSVGKSWNADSSCTAQTGFGAITIHATATRKVTGRVTTTIGGTSLTAWVVDSTLILKFTKPAPAPVNGEVDESSHAFYDPTRGIEVYDKSTSKGSGDFAYPETTTERQLKSLTPS